MFSGFSVDLNESFFATESLSDLRKIGRNHLLGVKKVYDETLKKYKKGTGLSADLIENDWFPEIKADVFISHSHTDKDLVEAFVGWLHRHFQLQCFIDSHVWNYANELIACLDQKYSNPVKKGNVTYYSYNKSNKVCEHANMMLAIALQKMIDRTESLFFVNAGNAARLVDGTEINETYSPWIYTEIACANMVRKKPLIAYRAYKQPLRKRQSDVEAMLECLQISYPLNLKGLEHLDAMQFLEWQKECSQNDYEYPLDALYKATDYVTDLNKTKTLSEHISEPQLNQIQHMFSVEEKEKDLRPLIESWDLLCRLRYGECPVYGGCRCRCCGAI